MAPTGIEPVLADRKSAVLATRRRGLRRASVGAADVGRDLRFRLDLWIDCERMFAGTGRPRKPMERMKARELRLQGMPIKRIARALDVSPSSVFYWTRDIELSAEQIRRNLRGPSGPQDPARVARRAASWRRRSREKRLGYQLDGRHRARRADPLHMAGCMLYWAEGTKSRNKVSFSNSDLNMIRFFGRFLRESLEVQPEQLTIRLNVYTGNGISVSEIEDHWLNALGLPRSVLRGHTLNHTPTSSSGQKTARLPYGVCSLTVLKSTHLVQHIYGAIQEYWGFEEPRWLDGQPVTKRPPAPAGPSARGGGSRPRRRRLTARRTARPQ
jgi:transposase-like protein